MTTTTLPSKKQIINGVDTAALRQLIDDVATSPKNRIVRFAVGTEWAGGTKSETRVSGYEFGGQRVPKNFTIKVDEPCELGGQNTSANPQELLLAAFNACMIVGYVAGAALHGIELESLSVESSGELDVRGFFGLEPSIKPGYERIHYTVRMKGNGTPEQFAGIHEQVKATSPNRWTIANPVKLSADLVVE
jgi:uncharacterized OsmC-like protein